MKEIILTDGQKAKVDDCDYAWLNQYRWYPVKRNGKTYAASMIDGQEVLMHELIWSRVVSNN